MKAKVKLARKKNSLKFLRTATSQTQKQTKLKPAFSIPLVTSKRRKSNPTDSTLPAKAKIVRRKETFNAVMAIHGASTENLNPAFDGMLDTITAKCGSKELSDKIINLEKPVVKQIKYGVIKDWSKEFVKSNENLLRSLNTYYSHNVMGKAKYISIRKANRITKKQKSEIPNYVKC